MKKALLIVVLLALSFGTFSCGGAAAPPADVPPGENPGVPSVVRLSPSHFIAQTNSSITLHVTVLDGNGNPVPNKTVTFTNLSAPFGILSSTTATTNSSGIATVSISSTTPGFATVLAQVYNGVSNVRDRKSVFFTTNDVLAVSMSLDVESVPPTSTPNEVSDFTLFETPFDDTVQITATVRNAGGVRVAGESVSWSSDLTGDNVTFLAGTEHATDVNGEARAVVKVSPQSIRNTETHLNIMAFAGNGAANMVTLFLQPVVVDVSQSSLTANPTVVNTGGTSDVTALVMLNTGSPAPDGTVVNFTARPKTASDPNPCGLIDPFGLTTAGVAKATFTAPMVKGTCTITGKVEGVTIGTVDIKVITKLTVLPPSATLVVGATSSPFTISGGVPPYTVISGNTAVATVSTGTVTTDGGTFTVTGAAAGSTTITVTDAMGSTVTVSITVTAGPTLTITPSSGTVKGVANPGGCPPDGDPSDDFKALISGGTPPYSVVSSNNLVVVPVCAIVISGGNLTIDPNVVVVNTNVTVIIQDSSATAITGTVTLSVTP